MSRKKIERFRPCLSLPRKKIERFGPCLNLSRKKIERFHPCFSLSRKKIERFGSCLSLSRKKIERFGPCLSLSRKKIERFGPCLSLSLRHDFDMRSSVHSSVAVKTWNCFLAVTNGTLCCMCWRIYFKDDTLSLDRVLDLGHQKQRPKDY